MKANYLTTAFGIMAGLPVVVANSGLTISPQWSHILSLVAGVGVVGLGVVAKDWNTTGNGRHATKLPAVTAMVAKGFIPSGKQPPRG